MSYTQEYVDGYQILFNRLIGSGAYANIYDCQNSQINEGICVKILRLDSNHTEAFKREAEVLRKIKEIGHINLIKIYHVTEQNNIIYIFMKKYSCNLEQFLVKKKQMNKILPIEEILKMAYQLINGYKQLYQNQIIHRDLKPENILIGDDGQLKISDFGLGKVIKELEQAGKHTMLGTPLFASPQCLITGKYSSKTDVYSIGAIIYYITFGRAVFQAKSLYDLIQQMNLTLQNQEIKIPNILNEGNSDQIYEIVDFFKLTITYSEEERIEWESLFKWFSLKHDAEYYSLQMSQQFTNQAEQILKKQEEIRKSNINVASLKQSQNSSYNSQQQQQPNINNFNQPKSTTQVSTNFIKPTSENMQSIKQQVVTSSPYSINQSLENNLQTQIKNTQNQDRAIDLLESQGNNNFQSTKQYSNGVLNNQSDQSQSNNRQIYSVSLESNRSSQQQFQDQQAHKVCQQQINLSQNSSKQSMEIAKQIPSNQITVEQGSIGKNSLQQISPDNNNYQELISLEDDDSKSFDNTSLADQFPQISSSIVLFFTQQFVQSAVIPDVQVNVKKNRLIKKSTNLVFLMTEAVFAKVSFTEKILDCIKSLLAREDLHYTLMFKTLQLLLAGYKYSILLNGYCLGFNDPMRNTTIISIEIKNDFSEEVITDYIKNTSLQVQSQRKQLYQKFYDSLYEIKDLLDKFYNKEEERANFPVIDIYRLFSDNLSYLNYKVFAKQYQTNFYQLFKLKPLLTVRKNDKILLKFIASSFQFIRNECEDQQSITKFRQLDLESLSFISDDLDLLIQNVLLNVPNLQIK